MLSGGLLVENKSTLYAGFGISSTSFNNCQCASVEPNQISGHSNNDAILKKGNFNFITSLYLRHLGCEWESNPLSDSCAPAPRRPPPPDRRYYIETINVITS